MDYGEMALRLRYAREKQNMTLKEIADKVGVAISTVQRYEQGKIDNPKMPVIEAISRALNVNPSWVVGKSDEIEPPGISLPSNVVRMPRGHRVPRLGQIACGEPILAEENFDGYDEVPEWIACDFTLACRGDSMTGAHIRDGDIVCIKQQDEVENGQIAAVRIDGEFESEATLKRVRYIDGGLALWPENPAFAPMIFTGEDVNKVHVIGLATHFIAKVR